MRWVGGWVGWLGWVDEMGGWSSGVRRKEREGQAATPSTQPNPTQPSTHPRTYLTTGSSAGLRDRQQ